MKLEDLHNLTEEEKNKFPFVNCFIEELKKIESFELFLEREEFIGAFEQYIINFSNFILENFTKDIMLGRIEFPLPSEYKFTKEEFETIHKRYNKIKKMNRLSKA